MKQRTVLLFSLSSVLILLAATFWSWMKFYDLQAGLEQCVLNEILITGDREFLLVIPQLVREAKGPDALIALLKKKYPGTLVEPVEGGVRWGRLKVELTEHGEFLRVTELGS